MRCFNPGLHSASTTSSTSSSAPATARWPRIHRDPTMAAVAFFSASMFLAGEVVAGLASRDSGRSTVSLAVCGIFVPALAEAVVQPKLLLVFIRSCNSDLVLLLANTPGASARVPRGAPALEPGCGKVCIDQDNALDIVED